MAAERKLNADELAERLGVSRRQVQLLAERREIPFYRVGPRALRFDEEEVMNAIKRRPTRPEEVSQGAFTNFDELCHKCSTEQQAEIARLKKELEALHHPMWVEHIQAKDAEINKLKAENLELSHTPSRLAEVEAERDYFEKEVQAARDEITKLRNERAMSSEREWLGKLVRLAWVKWAQEQPEAKRDWLLPWEELDERFKEVDRQIGEFIASQCVTPALLVVETERDEARQALEQARREQREKDAEIARRYKIHAKWTDKSDQKREVFYDGNDIADAILADEQKDKP